MEQGPREARWDQSGVRHDGNLITQCNALRAPREIPWGGQPGRMRRCCKLHHPQHPLSYPCSPSPNTPIQANLEEKEGGGLSCFEH